VLGGFLWLLVFLSRLHQGAIHDSLHSSVEGCNTLFAAKQPTSNLMMYIAHLGCMLIICSLLYRALVRRSPYAFGLYSNDLKTKLGLTQGQLQSIGSIGNVGFYTVALTGGLLFDAFGPHVTGAFSSVIVFVGYLLMYYGAGASHVPHTWVAMALYSAMWQNASSTGDLVAVSA